MSNLDSMTGVTPEIVEGPKGLTASMIKESFLKAGQEADRDQHGEDSNIKMASLAQKEITDFVERWGKRLREENADIKKVLVDELENGRRRNSGLYVGRVVMDNGESPHVAELSMTTYVPGERENNFRSSHPRIEFWNNAFKNMGVLGKSESLEDMETDRDGFVFDKEIKPGVYLTFNKRYPGLGSLRLAFDAKALGVLLE